MTMSFVAPAIIKRGRPATPVRIANSRLMVRLMAITPSPVARLLYRLGLPLNTGRESVHSAAFSIAGFAARRAKIRT